MTDNLQDLQNFFDKQAKEVFKSPEIALRPEILLTGERVLPLQGRNPRSILKSSEWTKTRRGIYKDYDYTCLACGFHAPYDSIKNKFVSDKLNAHELYKVNYEKKTMELREIVALCEHCHAFIHQHGMNIRYDKGIIDKQFCWEVIEQGLRVAGRDILHCNSTFEKEWKDWRFIFNGKTYKSNYKSFKEWQKKEEVMHIWWV